MPLDKLFFLNKPNIYNIFLKLKQTKYITTLMEYEQTTFYCFIKMQLCDWKTTTTTFEQNDRTVIMESVLIPYIVLLQTKPTVAYLW